MTGRFDPFLRSRQYLTDPLLPLAVDRQPQQQSRGQHRHDFAELVIIVAGAGVHATDNRDYPIRPGDVFVITGDRRHGYDQCRSLHLVNVIFAIDRLPVPTLDLRTLPGFHALFMLEPAFRRQPGFRSRLHLAGTAFERTLGLLERLEGELSARAPGYAAMAAATFLELITHLSRLYAGADGGAGHRLVRLGRVLCHLEENYAEAITLEQLADLANMSVATLLRVFRRGTGTTPIRYLLRFRVRRAAALLAADPDCRIADAAAAVGIHDANHFTRLFRREHDCTPREYVRLQRRLRAGA